MTQCVMLHSNVIHKIAKKKKKKRSFHIATTNSALGCGPSPVQACKKYPAGLGLGQAGLCPSVASVAAPNRRLLGLNLAEKK